MKSKYGFQILPLAASIRSIRITEVHLKTPYEHLCGSVSGVRCAITISKYTINERQQVIRPPYQWNL